jgi:TonB-dependent SusC/RagA subfamily outer membrane receptor
MKSFVKLKNLSYFNNSNESKIVGAFPIVVKREMPVEIKVNGAFENALIFVNDIEILDKKMNDISPSSIESVSVLKDHEAIKAYGPRAKDGVILIKTKTNFIKTDEKK